MNDVLEQLERWRQSGDDIAVATVVKTWGSAPRPTGSKMVTTGTGGIAGSVSAGCVEGAVIEASNTVMESLTPQLLHYGVADDTAWEVGLACGGEIEIYVEPFAAYDGVYETITARLAARQPMAVVTVIQGPDDLRNRKLVVLPDGSTEGTLDLPEQRDAVIQAALNGMAQSQGAIVPLTDDLTIFVEAYPPPPRLIVVGAVHIADALVSIANAVGFDTVVVDPRSAFATEERFPHANELIREWPQHALPHMSLDMSAYVVVLTHDPKLDDPALQVALPSAARYVGALGSTRTARKRVERLTAAGLSEEQLARLHGPIGLPLGGRTPEEIAVSIMAEIIQVKNSPLPVKESAHV